MEAGHENAVVTMGSVAVSATSSNAHSLYGEYGSRAVGVPGAAQSPVLDRARFYDKTSRGANGCLLWTAGKTKHGYGKFVLGGKTMGAHRAAWILEHGELLSPDQFLLHSCDTRVCVEITHLRVGTHAENMADRLAHGRYNTSRGMNNPSARFTDEDVARMRQMINRGKSYREIAEEFECSRGYIVLIAEGRRRTKPTTEPSPYVLSKLDQKAKASARRARDSEILAVVHPDDEVDGEEWRATQYDGYLVSSLGRVRGRNKTILKSYITTGGYAVVHCGKGNPRGVHTLVCEAWHGPRPFPGMHAAHNNGKSLDNKPQNLRWATPLENGNDRAQHRTARRGIAHHNAKLTPEKVAAIRAQLPGPRGTINRLAREYGVTKTVITQIRDNVTWRT